MSRICKHAHFYSFNLMLELQDCSVCVLLLNTSARSVLQSKNEQERSISDMKTNLNLGHLIVLFFF